jgi:hypothetical protein
MPRTNVSSALKGSMVSEEKNDGKQAAGLLPISVELLHRLLRLPAEVTVIGVVSEERTPGVVMLLLEGGELPGSVAGEGVPKVRATYEPFVMPTFLRFERIDDA